MTAVPLLTGAELPIPPGAVRILDEGAAPPAAMAVGPSAISASAAAAVPDSVNAGSPAGTIEIEMGGARVRIRGHAIERSWIHAKWN